MNFGFRNMGKSIIIAEKPSVGMEYAKVLGVTSNGKTNGYLENDKWIVTWTVGHLVTMSYPEKYDPALKEWKLDTLPFLPDQYKYEIIKETSKQFAIVKQLYNRPDIDSIYYAGDSGREGLYIQMLVRQFAGHAPQASEKVVWIDSQTEDEILRGISEAKDLSQYEAMKDSGYMRAIEDYAVGINFSRLLSVRYAIMLNSGSGQKKYKPISVGRVMTCVLGMIVNREREIRNFHVTNFYRIAGVLNIEGETVECEWKVNENSKYFQSPKLYSEYGFLKEQDAIELINCLNAEMRISNVTKTIEKKNAPLLFNLAELQGECTKKYHLSPAETLQIAQSLYEKKMTTYPRTDARVLTNAIAKEIGKNLSGLKKGTYGEYVEKIELNHWNIKGKYIDDSKVTDHYAIIPTGKVSGTLTTKEQYVYDMICRRFLAIFFPPAEYERVSFDAISENETFHGTNKYLVEQGYYEVFGFPDEDENAEKRVAAMSKLRQGECYSAQYEIRKGETTPPKRYTSGSIILAMEGAGTLIEDDELREQIKADGIGTSATRAEVIEKLLRLNYICVKDKKQVLVPSAFGEMIYEVVNVTLPELLSPEMTAKWEKGLDGIANGQIFKSDYEKELYTYIRETCNRLKTEDNTGIIAGKIRSFASNRIQYEYKEFDSYNTKIKCPLCGDDIETTSWGFRCKSNISKNEGCKFAIGDILGHRLLTNELATLLHYGKTGPYYDFISQKGKPFAAYLKWNNDSKKLEFELTDMPWNKTDLKCPICGKSILERDGFYRCEDYIDADHGCKFRIGKIKGKAIPIKQIEKLIKENSTDVIKGFKKEDGGKFDAFLIWDRENERVRFRFPEFEDMITNYHCPICNGKILATSYGYRCENYKAQEKRRETDCSFVLGNIMGHTIKEKELQTILNGGVTEPVSLKNKDKKSFEARLYWDNTQKKIALKFDDNVPVDVAANCPICGNRLKKNKFGYFCSKYSKNPGGCNFYVGTIAGISLDDKQVIKLVTEGKTDLIDGFKPKEKGKRPFSAYLKWDNADKKLQFEFPNADEMKEVSNYNCPVCKVHKLLKSKYGYQCECGFRFGNKIAEREIPDDQIKKLFVVGETDFISGFYSSRTRRMFTAKLVLNGNKIDFVLPEKVLEESDIKCPKCSACMKKGNVFFECECGYKIPHLIAAKHLTDEEVRQLMRGKTGLIKGFKSKTGKRFDAVLIADENGTVKFDFQNK